MPRVVMEDNRRISLRIRAQDKAVLMRAVVSVTLSRGALLMAKKRVIVKRLTAMQNLGSMDVLCTDKIGTLTEAKIKLEQHVDPQGNDAPLLRSADMGLSVDSAVDVAKEAADMILLDRNLYVLHDGVQEGRHTFGSIMKYTCAATTGGSLAGIKPAIRQKAGRLCAIRYPLPSLTGRQRASSDENTAYSHSMVAGGLPEMS